MAAAGEGSAQDVLADPEFNAALPSLSEVGEPAIAVPPTPARNDEALSAPLAPMAKFNESPPLKLSDVVDEPLPEVPYTVSLSGLVGLDVEDKFRSGSALLSSGQQVAPAAQIRLRGLSDSELLKRILQSEGYYDAKVELDFDPPSGRSDRLQVMLSVTPGQAYRLRDIQIAARNSAARSLARQALPLESGQQLQAIAVQAAEANVLVRLPQEGYPFAELGQRDIVLDGENSSADYTLPVDSGPLSRFGELIVRGAPFEAGHISIFPRFNPGDIYDSRSVEDLRQALIGTGLLSSVAIEPVRSGEVGPDGSEAVDLRLEQVAAAPRSLAASAGYSTLDGFKVSASWTHRNFFPPEGALSASATVGSEEQRLRLSLQRTNAGLRDRTLSAGMDLSQENRDAYQARSFGLNFGLSRDSTPLWQKRWTYASSGELLATSEERFEQTGSSRPRDTFLIAALPVQLGYDRSNSLLNPTTGYKLLGRLSPEVSKQAGTAVYGRLTLEGSVYKQATEALVFAARARVAVIAGADRDVIAPSRRFYAGGGGSVRGFGYQDLGPRSADGLPLGGRSLIEVSFEGRYRWKDFGIVPFVDLGQAYDTTLPRLDDLRIGVGIGGRYYTPFGPVRLDVATPISKRENEPSVAVYISIGQSF